jgi:cytochrome P450/NADPH-cytochrome P450 reductase
MSCPYQPENTVGKEQSTANSDVDEPIPQPPIHWFTRNIPEMDPNFPMSSIWRLADIYGPIYKLDFITHQSLILSSHELISEACDEDRFDKAIVGPLKETRALLGDGLFSAFPEEAVRCRPTWTMLTNAKHRIGGRPIGF